MSTTPSTGIRTRNIVISGTNFWNPGDDFVRDGVIRVLRSVFPGEALNFLFYNFNADFFPQSKFAGIGNLVAQGDLEKYRDSVDHVVIAGLSAGDEIKDLYRWVVANQLEQKVWLLGAGYENGYVDRHISQEPEATIFRQARIVTGRTAKTPAFIQAAGIPYHHLNCPAILSVPKVKDIEPGRRIQRIGFSIQLPTEAGLVNQTCARSQYELAVAVLRELAREYAVEVVAHHKTEYFHFLNLLRGQNIPVLFSSFYQDLHQVYPRYDLVVTTRLHASLFANGYGIPGIIINDTDRHTHTLDGFLHSSWVNHRGQFDEVLAHWRQADLAAVAREAEAFKANLLAQYVAALRPVVAAQDSSSVEASATASARPPAAPTPEAPPANPPLEPLPVHFFTIVLNGQPFIRHHIEQLRQLPFAWQWHIVEGVAELTHDTGWSVAAGGKVPENLHRAGLSVDGTSEYLEALQREFPDRIKIYRPPTGRFWDGKREMVNAPLANIREECLLWQIDADELWTQTQMIRARALFLAHPEKTAAYFFCHYFVGPELVISTRDTYGNHSASEWLRVWRYRPGDRWAAHEPPRLHRGSQDVATMRPFRHAETEAMGLVFYHYAYVLESQVYFKESYYGYAGAVAQWRQLQAARQWPVRLGDYLPWVTDQAMVQSTPAGLERLAADGLLAPAESAGPGPLEGAQRILFVRTDSIGDVVLASAMLGPIRRRYPQARLAVLCQRQVAELFAACPHVALIICYEREQVMQASERAAVLAEIAAFQPDIILNSVCSRDRLSDELTLGYKAARHIAVEGNLDNICPEDLARARAGYERLAPVTPDTTELARHAEFLRSLGVVTAGLQPVVWTGAADELLADAFFREHNLDPARTLACAPFTQHAPKDYPRFPEALADMSDWNVLLFGGAERQTECEELARRLPGKVFNLAGRASLRELAALVRRCRIFVGGDSCGAHIACAVGVPNVVVLGGGHMGRFLPYSALTSVAVLPLSCYGCNWVCPHARVHCVKDVAVEVVVEAIRQTLDKPSPRPRLFMPPAAAWPSNPELPAWRRPDQWLKGREVDFIEVSATPVASTAPPPAPAGNLEEESMTAACPVCRQAAPAALVKKGQAYQRCSACGLVFTARIDPALTRTQNNGNVGRHDQQQDAIRLNRLVQALGRPPVRLIDFGCGQGETTRFLQSQGLDVTGIDQDTPVQLGDLPDSSVDGIMMVEVIEHLYEPHAIFQDFHRILKAGGIVYLESSFVDGQDLATWPYLDPVIGHCTVHSVRSMALLAQAHGFVAQWLNANVCCFAKALATPKPAPAHEADEGRTEVELVGAGIPAPLVSVVVSTYQSEKFIGACLDNLSRQTIFDRCEVIVVDSGSPENERAIVAEFQRHHPNIRYVRTPRETLYGAWNRGLGLARGRYWANVNTDDALRNDALEILAAALDRHGDCALAYADSAWTTKPNDTFPSAHIVKTVKYPHYAPIETLFYCVTGCLQFFRTASLRTLGGFDAALRCAGDYEATLKMMAARLGAVHVPEVLSLFYQNTAGLTQASNRAAREHDQCMVRYREQLDIANIFQVAPNDAAAKADALAMLGVYAMKFSVPWETETFANHDFAFDCFHAALALDPRNRAAGMHLVALHYQLNRLTQSEAGLVERWPGMREWIDQFRLGEAAPLPPVKHALIGPVYRPVKSSAAPTAELLAREPEALRPWVTRIEGRHVYLSEDLFPRPAGLRYQPRELQAAAQRLAALLAGLPPFYAHFGGAGDALLLLASFYDQKPDAVVFSHPNGVGSARALFDAFPKLAKIYFLPQHAEPFFHVVLRYAVYQLRNCLGAGTTPRGAYDEEWKAGLDIESKYGIHKSPRWAAAWRRNADSRRVAIAPRGSLTGMVGSKRNLILPELWPQIIGHILERGYEPVILGVPAEAGEYPALPGCTDARDQSFPGQMGLIGQCAGLVGADSWAKTFSALAQIPTLVFEPAKGADIAAWKDASDWVFIEPWPAIKLIRTVEDFRRAFDARIAKLAGAEPPVNPRPAIAWEGSFLDYGSLSHINRELASRLAPTLNLTRVGPAAMGNRAKADPALQRCAKQLAGAAPANTAVTVRHQWPPNWSRPVSGSLVVIQPWEYGALPKAWLAAAANVDEFWVPSPLVRAMYVDSGVAPEKVRVVPNGVDSNQFRPGVPPYPLNTRKKFKFLFVGGTIFRKGPDILLEAYSRTFTAADDVCLVIKDFGGDSCYQGQTAEAAVHALQQRPGAPEILYLKDEFSAEQMPALYTACDCFVLPYRGEGFGLPVLEAMACALPVIVTGGGATESFVSAEAGWKIPSHGVRLTDRVGDIQLVKNGWLLDPSKTHLGALMKFAASHPQECRQRGAAGRAIVEKKFDWNDIAAAVAHRLKELAACAPAVPVIEPAPTDAAPVNGSPARTAEPPVVAQVGRLDEARELLTRKEWEAAWNATQTAVSKRPYHPDAYLLLAEIALAAGAGKAAKQCAQRARDLAPGWSAVKQFLCRSLKGDAKPAWLVAPPAAAHRLSVCLIVKNEERFLAQCLKSVRGLASQLIVVDTGSTDRTVEIAREFGAEIYFFAWCDDFAAARNAALEHATGDWVLMLDADEELAESQHAKLRADIKNAGTIAFRLPLVNVGQESEGRSFVPRLFRNAPGAFFAGRIHEQVFPSLLVNARKWGVKTALGSAELRHHGYTQDLVQDRNKVERNLKLLRAATEENPADVNLQMNLGLELVRSDELAAGIEKYRRAYEMMSAQAPEALVPELREVLLTQFTSQLYKIRAHEEVVRVLHSRLAQTGGLTASLHFALGLAHFELKQFSEAAEQMRQCLAKRQQPGLTPINTDILTAAPAHCLALCLARRGDAAAAEKAFAAALAEPGHGSAAKLDYAQFLVEGNRHVDALHQLNGLVAADSRHLAAWRLGGEIALGRPEFLEFALDWTAEAVKALPENPVVAAQRAEALMLNRQPDGALPLWEKLWTSEHQPRTLAALILCEIAAARPPHSPNAGDDERATSVAFVEWYQKLIAARANPLLEAVNARLEPLARTLPTAAEMLQAALAEATPAVAAE